MSNKNYIGRCLFFLGLFSMTQVRIIAYMDVTELVCYFLGPYFFVKEYPKLRKHGFATCLLLWALCALGCGMSCCYNATHVAAVIRGLGVPVSVFCMICVFHHFLSKDLLAVRWYFLGAALSNILSIFVLQRGATAVSGGHELSQAEAVEAAVSYSLFWAAQISPWISLPVKWNYLKAPRWYSIGQSIFLWFFCVFGVSSRASLGTLGASTFLISIGGKTRKSMLFMKRHFWIVAMVSMITIPLLSSTYKYLVVNKYFDEEAYAKYEKQTSQGGDMLSLLMAGRSEFFISLFAAIDRPLIGYGPWPVDTGGYYEDFMAKYGTQQDLDVYRDTVLRYGVAMLPTHSFVMQFWVWFGALGLICMSYCGFLYITTLKNHLAAIPEMYGYFAMALPSTLWAWMFSPFGVRSAAALLLTMCLFAKAIDEQRFIFLSKVREY